MNLGHVLNGFYYPTELRLQLNEINVLLFFASDTNLSRASCFHTKQIKHLKTPNIFFFTLYTLKCIYLTFLVCIKIKRAVINICMKNFLSDFTKSQLKL